MDRRISRSPLRTRTGDPPSLPWRFIVFCGVNPGARSAAAGAHFGNPRNYFWGQLADSGLTPQQLAPEEQWEMLELGSGLTNAAFRTTHGSSDLRSADSEGTAERPEAIARDLEPRVIAFVGKAAYQGAFREPPDLGLQERRLADTALFVLPSTSPANAAVLYEERLRWFSALQISSLPPDPPGTQRAPRARSLPLS